MKIIGLTGNIGSGKSTVARLFAEAGIPVIDADQLAREVVLPGTEALREIEVRFPGVVNEKGELDRAALGKRVFPDPAERVALEQITHPRIALEARRMLQALEDQGHPIAIYEAALIVEKNLQAAQDGLIVVSVSPEEQLRRVLARDKTSEAEVRARIAAQLPQEQKIEAATLVIDNSGPREALGPQIDRALKALGAPLKSAKIELEPLGPRSEPRPFSYLVTGFPKLIARRMALAFLAHAKTSSVTLLCRPRHLSEGRAFVEALPPGERVRTQVVDGDIAHLHLGLSTPEYRALTESVTDLFHAAEWSDLTAERHELSRVNVEGTRALLELADDCRYLRRFTHVSTVFVAGDRTGVIAEDELSSGQHFRNGYEETRCEAELLVRRAMTELPCTILRPSIVVGDSRTGEIDRFGGPYTIGIMLTSGPVSVPLPLPHDGVAPLNVVPIDYVVAAATHMHHDDRAIGRTFHLVDPNPASVRRIYQLVAQRMGRKLPKLSLGYRLTDALLKLPGLERLTREQRMAIATVNHLSFFSSRGTLELLDGTGIRCPPIESYLDALIEFVKSEYRRKKEG